MERRFLNQIAEGYLINHNIYGEFKESKCETIHATILNELNFISDHIYDVDIETYNEVREMSKLKQQRVFEIYLDSMYAKTDKNIKEVVANTNQNTGPQWSNKTNDQKWSSGTKGALAFAGLLTYLITKDAESKIPKAVVSTSNDGIFSALGTIADKTLDFIIDLLSWVPTPFWWILLAAAFMKRKKLAKKTFEYLAVIGKFGEHLGDFIKKKGRYAKFRYAVIQKNREDCYKKCGITNLENINIKDYLNKYAGDKINGPRNAKCLANCYITTEMEKIKLLVRMYFICLRQTGNFDRVKNMNVSKLVNLLKSDSHRQSSFGLAATCGEYYNEISEGIDKVNDLIEFFFEDKSSQQELKMALQKDVDDVKYDIANMSENELRKFRLTTN